MSYATYDELIVRYPAVKNWGLNETEVSSDLLYNAGVYVDGRFAPKFTVPFSPTPPTIHDITLDVAYFKALWRFDPEKAKDFQDYVDGRIDGIMAGSSSIFTGSGSIAKGGAGDTVWSNTMGYQPTFSMLDASDPLSQVSSERLYDEQNARD